MTQKQMIIHFAATILCVSLCPAAQGSLTESEAVSLFTQANEAFTLANAQKDSAQTEALFEKAIMLFERLIREGDIHNAKLYYNLANAYLHNGDIGKAILNYRRAETLDKNDEDIQKNLAFARSRRIDQVELETQTRILHTLFFWHYDFGIRTRFALMCVFFGLACTGLTFLIWLKRRSVFLATSLISLGLCLAMGLSVSVTQLRSKTVHHGVITAPEVTARQGDGESFPPSFRDPLHAGTEFLLLEARPDWLHIQLDNGSKAWIPDETGEVI